MAFDAGELVATLRMAGLSAFSTDAQTARRQFAAIGQSADAAGAAGEQVGRRSAAGATVSVRAMQDAATRSTAAAQRSAAAQTAAADRAAARAAAAAERAAAAEIRAAERAASQASTQRERQAAAAEAAAARETAAAEAAAAAQARSAAKVTADEEKYQEERKQKGVDAARELGASATAFGIAATGAFVLATKAQADFGAQMAQLKSLSRGSDEQMEAAAKTALTAGTKYGLSAVEVAQAQVELQKAGIGLTEQMGGALPGALTLAAAGQMDVASATSIAVQAMTQFGLSAKDVPHIADQLASGADNSVASVASMGDSLNQTGLVAHQFGWSLEETVATLTAFSQAGLNGSDGGTSLKTALLALASPSKQQAEAMKQLGIETFDASGNFVTAAELAEQLKVGLGKVDQQTRLSALGIIFGSDAARAAGVAYDQGAAGIEKYTEENAKAGFAADQAAGKQDSLAGALKKLSAVIQNDLILVGSGLVPLLTAMADGLSTIGDAAAMAPDWLLAAAAGVTGLAGVVGLGTGALLLFLPKILETRVALRVLRQEAAFATYGTGKLSAGLRGAGAAAGGLRAGLGSVGAFLGGPLMIALAVGTVAFLAYEAAIAKAKASTDVLDAAAAQGAKGIDQLVAAAAKGQNEQSGIFAFLAGQGADVETGVLDDLAGKLSEIRQNAENPIRGFFMGSPELGAAKRTLESYGSALARVAQTDAPAAAASFVALGQKYKLDREGMNGLLESMRPYEEALRASAISQGLNVTAGTEAEQTNRLVAFALKEAGAGGKAAEAGTKAAAGGIQQVGESAEDAKTRVDGLKAAIDGIDGGLLDARAAERAFQDAIDAVSEAVEENGRTTDEHTEKGRANAAVLDSIAQRSKDVAKARLDEGKATTASNAALARGRKEYVDAARQMGMLKGDAELLADSIFGIPTSRRTRFDGDTRPARTQIADLRSRLRELGGEKTIAKIDASKESADAKLQALKVALQRLEDERHQIFIDAIVKAPSVPAGIAAPKPKRASGGDLDVAPGAKGVDSQLFWGAKGEHVLTADDVDAMGGQRQVYAWRRGLHQGVRGYARGGALGDAQSLGTAASSRAAADDRKIAAARRDLARLRKDAKAADRAAEKASNSSAAIHGKGSAESKHAAAMTARQLKQRSTALDKKVTAAEKVLSKLEDHRSKQQDIADRQAERRTNLTEQKQDLGFSLQQGNLLDAGDPYGAMSQALSSSRSDQFTKAQRASLFEAAKTQGGVIAGLVKSAATATASFEQQQTEASKDLAAQAKRTQAAIDSDNKVLSGMEDAASKAASALSTVQGAFDSLHDSVATTITSFFELGDQVSEAESKTTSLTHNAGTAAAWDEKVTTTTTPGATVGGIRAAADTAARAEQDFADQLQGLVQKGYSTAVVQDVARQGVTKGGTIAAALLSGTQDDVTGISASYAASSAAGDFAGVIVSQQAYGLQLAAAQSTADAADEQVRIAQAQLEQDQALATAQELAGDARLESLKLAEAAATESSNRKIEAAQQAIVAALQAAISGPVTASTGGKSIQQSIDDQVAALQRASTSLSTKKKADGGIVDRFAEGGFRPAAHIVPAGRNAILYGEPETGGEAFIPFAPAKRTRSLAILNESARRMGRQVVPAGGRTMADGGVLGTGPMEAGDFFDLRGAVFTNTSRQDVIDGLTAVRKGKLMGTALRRPKP